MMANTPDFDLEKAHRYFSAECFNRAWDYIDKPVRTPEEDRLMLQLSMASIWHWSKRPDQTRGNLSIGYWQLSRIYILLGEADSARQYGQLCLETSRGEGTLPYHLGYAYETLARAEALAGNKIKSDEYLRLAREVSEKMTDPEARQMLIKDLDTIE
jgi:hypothetical protein